MQRDLEPRDDERGEMKSEEAKGAERLEKQPRLGKDNRQEGERRSDSGRNGDGDEGTRKSHPHCPRRCAIIVGSLATSVQRVQNEADGQSSRFWFAAIARRKGTRLQTVLSRARNATGGPFLVRAVHDESLSCT
jgi:hypothetical protein